MSKPWEEYAPAAATKGPWQDYAEKPSETSALEAGVRGAADYSTGGFADELTGAVIEPKGAVKALIGRGSEDPDVQRYQKERDESRANYEKAAKEHPVAYHGSGVVASIVGPGKLVKGAKGAIALGGLAGLGNSQAELADQQYGRTALDTALGMTMGYVGNKVGEKIGEGISKTFAPAAEETVETTVKNAAPETGNNLRQAKRWAEQIFETAKPVDNADEVAGAIKQIAGENYEVPGYLLTKDRPTQNLADSLIKSPTIGGKLTRQEVMPIYDGLERFGKAVADRAGGLSPHETGEAVKRGVAERFKTMIAPAEEIYDQLETKFAGVPVERIAFKRGISKLRRQFATDPTGKSQALLDSIENTFNESVPDVAALRSFRTNLGKYLEGGASDAQKSIVGQLYGVLTRERDRSILRSAVTTGPKIARQGKSAAMLSGLKQADRIYREGVTTVGDALGIEGSKGTARSVAIRDYLQNTPAEQVVKDLFDRGDFSAMSRVQGAFPEQFQQLKDLAIQDLIKASTVGTELSPQRLSTNLGKYGPEVQKILLGDLLPQAQAAKLTLGALPENFNPSKTSTGMQYHSILTPQWWTSNVASLGQRQILQRGAPRLSVTKAAQGVPNMQTVMTKITKNPAGAKWAEQLAAAAKRGPSAWASTYYVLSTSDPAFRAMIQEDEGE